MRRGFESHPDLQLFINGFNMNYLPYNVRLINSKVDTDNILHLDYYFTPIKPLKFKYIKCNVIINRDPQEGEWFEYSQQMDE